MRRVMIVPASLAAGLMAGTAQALPSHDSEVTYYAEPQMKTYVGSRWLPCGSGAHIVKDGRVSRYYTRSDSTCVDTTTMDPPPPINCNFTQAGCSDNLGHSLAAATLGPRRPVTKKGR